VIHQLDLLGRAYPPSRLRISSNFGAAQRSFSKDHHALYVRASIATNRSGLTRSNQFRAICAAKDCYFDIVCRTSIIIWNCIYTNSTAIRIEVGNDRVGLAYCRTART